MHGWEIIVFRKYMKMNNVSGVETNAPSWATRTEQCHDEGAIFVSPSFSGNHKQRDQALAKSAEKVGTRQSK